MDTCISCHGTCGGQLKQVFQGSNHTSAFQNLVRDVYGISIAFDIHPNAKYCKDCAECLQKVRGFKENLLQAGQNYLRGKLRQLDQKTPSPVKEYGGKRADKPSCCKVLFELNSEKTATQQEQVAKIVIESGIFRQFNDPVNVCSKTILDLFKTDKHIRHIIEQEILKEIHLSCGYLCSLTLKPGPSILREKSKLDLLADQDVLCAAILELEKAMPFVLDILKTLCTPAHIQKPNTVFTVASIYCQAMFCRNHELSALQKLNTCAIIRYHGDNNLLKLFNKLSLSLSISSKIPLLEDAAGTVDKGIIESLKQGKFGKLTVDNIDGRTIANEVRLNGGNKHYHFTASTFFVDRLKTAEVQPFLSPLPQVDLDIFYLNESEALHLKKMYQVHIGRILVKYCPAFAWMKATVPLHIPHEYSDVMSKKTEMYPMKVILRDPKYLGESVLIMDELISTLENAYEKAGRDDFQGAAIPLGGDQLVRVRMAGAKALRRGSHTAKERLQQLDPIVIELFHVQQDFLEKLFKKFYKSNSTRLQGTLANFKVQLARSDVNGLVKGHYRAHHDFLLVVGEALLLKLCMTILGMDTPDSQPDVDLPVNIAKMRVQNRQPYSNDITAKIAQALHHPFQPKKLYNFEVRFGDESINAKVPSYQLHTGKPVQITIPEKKLNIIVPSQVPPQSDELKMYTMNLLQWVIHYIELGDAIKEGDIRRTSINMKHLIPLFYSATHRSKYFVECIEYIQQTQVLLPPDLALRVQAGSFVNLSGGIGNNKPADMQQEINIGILKDVIKGLGAAKTKSAIQRATAAAPVIANTIKKYTDTLQVLIPERGHSHKSTDDEVQHLLRILSHIDPCRTVENRLLESFEHLAEDPFILLKHDFPNYQSTLEKVSDRLKRRVQRYEDGDMLQEFDQ